MADEPSTRPEDREKSRHRPPEESLVPREIEQDLRQMASEFETFARRVERALATGWSETFPATMRLPRLDLEDAPEEYRVKVDLPGVSREGLEVSATEHSVTVHAEVRREQERRQGSFLSHERSQRAFHRQFDVPEAIVPAKVTAELIEGVLHLVLPKVQRAAATRVPVH